MLLVLGDTSVGVAGELGGDDVRHVLADVDRVVPDTFEEASDLRELDGSLQANLLGDSTDLGVVPPDQIIENVILGVQSRSGHGIHVGQGVNPGGKQAAAFRNHLVEQRGEFG